MPSCRKSRRRPSFTAELRPYQQYGLDWLQHLRANAMAGILADDMGLGKTAQTLAHIAVEDASGRLDRPVLIVVPTSLVANWVSEAAKFVPALRLVILHGLDRHQRRNEVYSAQLVVTTYTVLARDIEAMRSIDWHLVVLDEAQAVKNPDTNVSRAVRQLRARHRLCLSGTPVENNLGEIWSQFAFLVPGLLGDRRLFAKRFRTPIERDGDIARRALLARRLKPFVLRRTKGEVATDLPPKTEIIRRVELEIDQRDLYETIRLSMHEKLRHEIKLRSLERSRILVLDALLKLRQVCCDPRLVKLAAARRSLRGDPRDQQQARGVDEHAARARRRRKTRPGVFPVHLDARFDQARTRCGGDRLCRADRGDRRPRQPHQPLSVRRGTGIS